MEGLRGASFDFGRFDRTTNFYKTAADVVGRESRLFAHRVIDAFVEFNVVSDFLSQSVTQSLIANGRIYNHSLLKRNFVFGGDSEFAFDSLYKFHKENLTLLKGEIQVIGCFT